MKKSKYSVCFLVLIEVFLSSCHRAETNRPKQDDFHPKAPKAIAFAGLSGSYPRYIDSGPSRGLGWMENQTLAIRKGLKEEGFEVEREWMTPARIAHEIRSKNPICYYPAEWTDPETLFGSVPDRLYSIPLDLGGEQTRTIVINREDLSKFKKHLDAKGDLDIDSLLADPTLKTVLVRNRDYGRLTQKLLDVDSQGDQIIKEQYRRNVSLMMVHENRQLAEMLAAKRFDFAFSDSFENEDLVQAGIDPKKFHTVSYSRTQVIRIDDPSLVRVSVACSIHPLTIQAMPHINKWIAAVRGRSWVASQIQYREKLDPKYADQKNSYHESVVNKLGGDFLGGLAEAWYPKQQKYFPGLELFPKRAQSSEVKLAGTPLRPLRRGAIYSESGELILLSEADAAALRAEVPRHLDHPEDRLFLRQQLKSFLSRDQLKRIEAWDPMGPGTTDQGFSFIPLEYLKSKSLQLNKITVFAAGLSSEELEVLRPFLVGDESTGAESGRPGPTELAVFEASPETARWLIKLLPRSLQTLNLTSSSLSLAEIQTAVAQLSLKRLFLNNSQVTLRQMAALIRNIPDTIEELSLGHHHASWTDEEAKAFSKRKFKNLKSLNLESCFLTDAQLNWIGQAIPSSLERLILGQNSFTPVGIKKFFSKEFPNLTELDLSSSILVSKFKETFKLPQSIKRLSLQAANLTPETLQKLELPAKLSALDVSENALTDGGAIALFAQLGSHVELLDLWNTKITGSALDALSQSPQIEAIDSLGLASNALDDGSIQMLSKARFKLKDLDLSQNRITNAGASTVAKTWAKTSVALNLSNNFISSEGINQILEQLNPNLEGLSLNGMVSLDAQTLAQKLPSNLKRLELGSNQLSDSDLGFLAPRLPASLVELHLDQAALTSLGVKRLAQALPRGLYSLTLTSTPLEGIGLALLLEGLPPALGVLELEQGGLLLQDAKRALPHLPKGLNSLSLSKIRIEPGATELMMRSLPGSLSDLRLSHFPVQRPAAEALADHWPRNLRFLHLESLDLGDLGFKSLLQHFPVSLESFEFMNLGISEAGLLALLEQPLENLFRFNNHGDSFTEPAIRAIGTRRRAIRLFVLSSSRVNDQALSAFSKEVLAEARILVFGSLQVSNRGLLQLSEKLSPELTDLILGSMGLKAQSVEKFIQLLPKKLRSIYLTGNEIGDLGYEKIREHGIGQERQTGVPLKLIE